jgi:hypothetical protein
LSSIIEEIKKWKTTNMMFAHSYAAAGHFETLVRKIDVRALVLLNHPKSIRLFEHSENNLT